MRLGQKVAVNASAMTLGRLVGAAIGVVAVGITTRYLGVEDFGALTAATAFSTVVQTLTDVGVWTIGAREIAKRPGDTQRLVGNLLTVGFVLSVAGGGVALAVMFLLYSGQDNELVRRGILLLLLTVPLAAPFGAVSAYFVAQQKAYLGTIANVAQSVITFGLIVAFAALGLGYTAIVLAYVIAAASQVVIMLAFSVGKVRLVPAIDRELVKQLVSWALPLGGVLLLGALYWRLDIVILSLLKPQSEVAVYGLAYKIVDALVVLPSYVTITLLPEFARLAEHRDRLDQLVAKALAVIQLGTAALLMFSIAFAGEVVELVGGSAYTRSARVLRILMVGVAAQYLAAVFSQVYIALNRQRTLFLVLLLVLPLNIGLNLVLIPRWGPDGAAAAFCASEIVGLVALVVMFSRFATVPRPYRVPQMLAAVAAAAAVASIKLLPFADGASPILVLSLGALVCLPVYAACLYGLKAIPRELHAGLVLPLLTRLRPGSRG